MYKENIGVESFKSEPVSKALCDTEMSLVRVLIGLPRCLSR